VSAPHSSASAVPVDPADGTAAEPMAALPGIEVELFSVAGMDGSLRQVNTAFAMLLEPTRSAWSGPRSWNWSTPTMSPLSSRG